MGRGTPEPGVAAAWIARNRSSQRSRRDSSANRTSSVLSPARVPSCSASGDSSMAWAIDEAVPGVPMRSRMSPLRPTVTGMSRQEPTEALVGGAGPGRARSSGAT